MGKITVKTARRTTSVSRSVIKKVVSAVYADFEKNGFPDSMGNEEIIVTQKIPNKTSVRKIYLAI